MQWQRWRWYRLWGMARTPCATLAIVLAGAGVAHGAELYAVVKATGDWVRGNGVVSSTLHAPPRNSGTYDVDFGRDISPCFYIASVGWHEAGEVPAGQIATARAMNNQNAVRVQTRNSPGSATSLPFHLLVGCSPSAAADRADVWAVIDEDGGIVRKSGAVSATRPDKGRYEIEFNRDVSRCAFLPTIGSWAPGADPPAGEIGATHHANHASRVVVYTRESGGTRANRPFHLYAACPQ